MRLEFWIAFALLGCIGNVNSRLTKSTRVDNEIVVTHHRKLIQADSDDAISGSYIVQFTSDISDEEVEQKARELAAETGGKILWIYKLILKGFTISGLGSNDHLATILGRDDVEVMDQVRISCKCGFG